MWLTSESLTGTIFWGRGFWTGERGVSHQFQFPAFMFVPMKNAVLTGYFLHQTFIASSGARDGGILALRHGTMMKFPEFPECICTQRMDDLCCTDRKLCFPSESTSLHGLNQTASQVLVSQSASRPASQPVNQLVSQSTSQSTAASRSQAAPPAIQQTVQVSHSGPGGLCVRVCRM